MEKGSQTLITQVYAARQRLLQARLSSALVLVWTFAVLVLDLFFAENDPFFYVRLAGAIIAGVVLGLTFSSATSEESPWLRWVPLIVLGLALELVYERTHGGGTPENAGIALCLLFFGLVYSWRVRETMLLAGAVVLFWVMLSWSSTGSLISAEMFRALLPVVLGAALFVWASFGREQLAVREQEARKQLAKASETFMSTVGHLKALDQRKSEFFANVSHELRTPLALIIGPVEEVLRKSDAKSPHLPTLQMIHRNAGRLLRLIDDLMDLARLDEGRVRLNIGRVELGSLVFQIVEAIRLSAQAKQIDLELDIKGTITNLYGDTHRLESVITNLVGNALKFTPSGGKIVVRATPVHGGAELTVSDTGPGIPPGEQERIFERFYQVSRPGQAQYGGMGIGLALARELAELHGGKLSVRSDVGRGSTFVLWLPEGKSHFRADVVERRQAATGAASTPAGASRREPDSDGQLPGVSRFGGGPSRPGRSTPPKGIPATASAPAPVAPASTGSGPPVSQAADKAPVYGSPAETAAFGAQSNSRWSTQPPVTDKSRRLSTGEGMELDRVHFAGNRRPRVLVAEDEKDLQRFIRDLLAPAYEVVVADNGRIALELVSREHPDLVLTDVMMPEMSGTALCAALKSDPATQVIPVILMTARTGTEPAVEGFAHGADDFVPKPFENRVLLARVRAQLKLRAMTIEMTSHARLAAVGTLAAGVAHEVRNPLNALLNAAEFLSTNTCDAEGERKLLGIITDAGRRIAEITRALEAHARPAEANATAPCDVRGGVESTLRLLEHRMNGVKVHCQFVTDRKPLVAAGALNQVIMNLLDNAFRSKAKNVWVAVDCQDDQVRVRISDDGPGIPADIAPRIFDPFFTTRAPGEGTGLGLYLSRNLIAQYGGELALGTRAGGGAEFSISLPAESLEGPRAS